jgi:hypothetical protein
VRRRDGLHYKTERNANSKGHVFKYLSAHSLSLWLVFGFDATPSVLHCIDMRLCFYFENEGNERAC